MKHKWSLFVALLLAACGDGKQEAAEQLAADQAAQASSEYLLDLEPFDMPLVVSLPQVLEAGPDSVFAGAQWVEEFGHLRVGAGERFGLTIMEDAGDMARLKAGFERDMLRTFEVIEESPDILVYRMSYPDDALVFIHFYQVIRVGDRSFVVESASDGRFNEADVAIMVKAVRPAAVAA
ncbi:MAG: hypothetical protein KF905_04370 [Flavobacteriales bacterium]|nr:hypothetical protein [Flavobacteriales bacterium]